MTLNQRLITIILQDLQREYFGKVDFNVYNVVADNKVTVIAYAKGQTFVFCPSDSEEKKRETYKELLNLLKYE